MSHELKEGTKLKSVFLVDGGEVKAGNGGCASIVVAEQTGQMAMVPWAKVTREDGTVQLYNLALAEGCVIEYINPKSF